MKRETDVNNVLGEKNVKLFLAEVRNGLITEDDLEQIALQMDGRVHGTYVEKVSKVSPESSAQHMLDTWYEVELYDPHINGKEKFLSILEDESIGQIVIVEMNQAEDEREQKDQSKDEEDHNCLSAIVGDEVEDTG